MKETNFGQMSDTQLSEAAKKYSDAYDRAETIRDTIGTPDFSTNPVFDLSDETSTEFVDTAIRIGLIKQALNENAIPTLSSLANSVSDELVERDRLKLEKIAQLEEKITQLESKIVKLKELKEKGYLPTPEAITIAQAQLDQLLGIEDIKPADSKAPEVKMVEIKAETETVIPSLKKVKKSKGTGPKEQIISALQGKNLTSAEIALEIYGENTPNTRRRVWGWITMIRDSGTIIVGKLIEGEKFLRYSIEIPQEEITTRPEPTVSISTEVVKPQVEKKDFRKNPIPPSRLMALEAVLTGKASTAEQIIQLLGHAKNNRPLHWGQAARALSLASNILRARIQQDIATPEEQAVWRKIKEASKLENPKEITTAFFDERVMPLLRPSVVKEKTPEIREGAEDALEGEITGIDDGVIATEGKKEEDKLELGSITPPTIMVPSVPISVVEEPGTPKLALVEQRIPTIRKEIREVIEKYATTKLEKLSVGQVRSIFSLSIRDMRNLQEHDYVRPEKAKGNDRHPVYTPHEAVAMSILKRYYRDLNPQLAKQIHQLVAEEFEIFNKDKTPSAK